MKNGGQQPPILRDLLGELLLELFGNVPECLVEIDVTVDALDRAGRDFLATTLVVILDATLPAPDGVLLNDVQRAVDVLAVVGCATSFEQLRRGDGSLLNVAILRDESSLCEGVASPFIQLDALQLPDAVLNPGDFLDDLDAGFDDLRRVESDVSDRDASEGCVADDETVQADCAEDSRVKLISAAPVVAVRQDDLGTIRVAD